MQQILQAAIDHYATEFAAGQVALSHIGTNDFYTWRHTTNIETDVQTYMDAFKNADSFYNADNEPTDAITAWQNDIGQAQGDIVVWINLAVSWQIGDKSDADLAAATATVNKDLDAARNDLVQVLSQS